MRLSAASSIASCCSKLRLPAVLGRLWTVAAAQNLGPSACQPCNKPHGHQNSTQVLCHAMQVAFNLDSSNVGPKHWVQVSRGASGCNAAKSDTAAPQMAQTRHPTLLQCRAAAGASVGRTPR